LGNGSKPKDNNSIANLLENIFIDLDGLSLKLNYELFFILLINSFLTNINLLKLQRIQDF